MTRSLPLAPLALAISCAGLPASAGAADVVAEALSGGEAHLDTRLRHESVTVDPSSNDDATALTLRTRLGYTTAPLAGLTGMVEFEDVRTVADTDEYAPVQPGYEVVADPPVTELNQAFLNFDSGAGVSARYGRQRIILDNARFVGNVGWRQDEQTFDAARVDYDHEHLHATLGWITAVNGILPRFDANTSDALAHLNWKTIPGGDLSLYGYLLENDPTERELDTLGARYTGETELDPLALLYTLEYATQERSQPNTTDREADYRMVEAGVRWQGVTVKAAQEVLGSDDGNYGFQTPLATKHAFNGWGDQFLVTPAAGLEDSFFTLATKIRGTKLKAVHHSFAADANSTDYGTETDLLIARSFGEHYQLGAKYADFSADTTSGSDVRKYWIWGTVKF